MDKALELFSRIDILVNGESVNIFTFPDVLTSRKSTNFLFLVEEFQLIQQRNYHIIFQKKSETKISSNQCKKINGYLKDFLPSISDCRSLYRLGNLGIFQHVI